MLLLKLFFAVVLICLIRVIFKKTNFAKTIKIVLSVALGFLLVAVIFIPFKSILTYKTPEEVYQHIVGGEYLEVVEGQESSAFLYKSEDDSVSTLFVLKDGDKYKKCSFFDFETIYSAFPNGVVVDLIHVKNTNDYYLLVWGIANDIQISDNLNTDFNLIYENFASQTAVICMESIIYDSDYELYINDSLVSFD